MQRMQHKNLVCLWQDMKLYFQYISMLMFFSWHHKNAQNNFLCVWLLFQISNSRHKHMKKKSL